MSEQQTSFSHSVNMQFGRAQRGPGFGFWLGLILVVIGAGLLLDAFVDIEFGRILGMWWPSLLMFIAVAQLATGSGSLVGSGIIFTIGALLQLSKLGHLPGGFWSAFWPIVLILIGLSFISSRWKKKDYTADPDSLGHISHDGSRIDRSALFTGVETRVTSSDFSGGELTAIFGGVECDLRDARMMGKLARLTTTAVFGGIEIRVPREWNVVVKGTPIFGGIDDKNVINPQNPDAPTLLVDATAIFGGVEIRP